MYAAIKGDGCDDDDDDSGDFEEQRYATNSTNNDTKRQSSLCFQFAENCDVRLGIALSHSTQSNEPSSRCSRRLAKRHKSDSSAILSGAELANAIEHRASEVIAQSFGEEASSAAEERALVLSPSRYAQNAHVYWSISSGADTEADIATPKASLLTPQCTESQPLLVRNANSTAFASWTLKQLQVSRDAFSNIPM